MSVIARNCFEGIFNAAYLNMSLENGDIYETKEKPYGFFMSVAIDKNLCLERGKQFIDEYIDEFQHVLDSLEEVNLEDGLNDCSSYKNLKSAICNNLSFIKSFENSFDDSEEIEKFSKEYPYTVYDENEEFEGRYGCGRVFKTKKEATAYFDEYVECGYVSCTKNFIECMEDFEIITNLTQAEIEVIINS